MATVIYKDGKFYDKDGNKIESVGDIKEATLENGKLVADGKEVETEDKVIGSIGSLTIETSLGEIKVGRIGKATIGGESK